MSLIKLVQLQSLSLSKQVDLFLEVNAALKKKLAPKHFSKSLFIIVTGSNDIYSYFGSPDFHNKRGTPEQFVNLMALTFKGQMKVIIKKNISDTIFGVVNLIELAS